MRTSSPFAGEGSRRRFRLEPFPLLAIVSRVNEEIGGVGGGRVKINYVLIGLACAALSGHAMAATNILPGSGDTVAGSSIHSGFSSSVAGGNLINGTSNAAYYNGDTRWVFADGDGAEETLTVDLGSKMSVDAAGFSYSGVDRVPTSFEVLTSTTGSSFSVVAGPFTPPYGANTTYTYDKAFTPTLAQYVEFDFGTYSIADAPNAGGGVGQGAGISQLSVGAVPEPSTWAMMIVGFAGLGFAGYRKAKSAHFAAGAV
jgi:F5/8 type C domain-containing protein/PEP-CTERM motif-containing protein